MTRDRCRELLEQCEADLERAIAQGDHAWAKTQRDRRRSLLSLLRRYAADEQVVEKEAA